MGSRSVRAPFVLLPRRSRGYSAWHIPRERGNPDASPPRAYACVHVSVSWAPRPLSLCERGRWWGDHKGSPLRVCVVLALATRPHRLCVYAQMASVPFQRLKVGWWFSASVARACSHIWRHLTGSCNSDSGLFRLRATKPGRNDRPVGCPTGL